MKRRCRKVNLPATIEFKVMDCRRLKYEKGEFDLVIDKSTIDSLLCGKHAF